MTPFVVGDMSLVPFVTYTIQFPLIVAIFFLSCWADPAPLYMEFDSKLNWRTSLILNMQ